MVRRVPRAEFKQVTPHSPQEMGIAQPILQLRKLRHGEVRSLGHCAPVRMSWPWLPLDTPNIPPSSPAALGTGLESKVAALFSLAQKCQCVTITQSLGCSLLWVQKRSRQVPSSCRLGGGLRAQSKFLRAAADSFSSSPEDMQNIPGLIEDWLHLLPYHVTSNVPWMEFSVSPRRGQLTPPHPAVPLGVLGTPVRASWGCGPRTAEMGTYVAAGPIHPFTAIQLVGLQLVARVF